MYVYYTFGMKKLGANIDVFLATLTGDKDQMRINLRAHQVRARYKSVLQLVYRDTADLFLEHTNNVYIMNKDGVKTLIVYVDESIFAAELNAQRELIKLKMLEEFNEDIEQFQIYISRGRYRDNHPYETSFSDVRQRRSYQSVPLSQEDEQFVSNTVSKVEGHELKTSLEKAMTASIALNKAENLKQS